MSIPEKLITATENVQKVYESGKNSMVDESKLLPTTVSGSYISLDDVSEVPHKVNAKLACATTTDFEKIKVTRCAKNLFDIDMEPSYNSETKQTFTKIDDTTTRCTISFGAGGGNGMSLGVIKSGMTFTISGIIEAPELFSAGGDVRIVLTFITNNGVRNVVLGDPINKPGTFSRSYTIPNDYDGCRLYFRPGYNLIATVYYFDISYLQIEIGSTATNYEPYNGQTLTPTADGTVEGMISVSPYMNIFSNADGVSIEATYNKSWGMQTEYDRFWDDFQQNGTRTNYYAAFAGVPWTVRTFKPKYKVIPIDTSFGTQNAHSIFFHCNRNKRELIDFRTVAHLFDFSNVINPTRAFAESGIDYITTDFSNAETLNETFSQQWGASHTHITLTISDKCTNYNLCFANSTKLTDLIFTDGSIIAANLDLKDSPLNKESIASVINALSPTVSGKTLLLKKTATEAAFTDEGWTELITTKPNWNISLL